MRELFIVSTMTVANGKGGSDRPEDPRDENVTPRAQLVEDLETVPLFDTLTDQQLKIGTSLSPPLRAEFIALFGCICLKRQAYDAERYEAMKLEVDKLKTIDFIREVAYPIWLANLVLVKKTGGPWRMC
ncbi:unnamed protein product [Prunus armeniaca]